MFLSLFSKYGFGSVSYLLHAGGPDVLHVSADRIVAGIVFHLLDEGLATCLEPGPLKSAIDRLRANRVRGSIQREVWLAMTNRDRLEWLLEQGSAAVRIRTTGVAVLEFRPRTKRKPRFFTMAHY